MTCYDSSACPHFARNVMVGSKARPEISGNLEAREMMAIRLTAEVVTPGNRVPLGLRVPLPRTSQSAQGAPARLLPGHTFDPGFGVVAVLSTRHRGFAYDHLSSPHLTGAPAFSLTLTTRAFDPSRSWRFEASP